ncbi:MAG: response regulator [Cyanobacteriota bacterium]
MNPPIQPNSPLVLVADDDRTLRALLRLAMEEEGYQVAEANNGENCLSEFARLQPDIVLLDAVMPVMDGFICCQQLRTFPGTEHTPVLMITVLDDQDSVDQAFAAGATDYITKPIHWAVLRQRVARLLAGIQSLQQVQQITEALQKQSQRECLFRSITRCLTQARSLEEILNPTLKELQEFLKVNQVDLYHKNENLTVIYLTKDGKSPVKSSLEASEWEKEYAKEIEAGKVVVISDIQQEGIPASVIKRLGKLNIKAALIVPILIRGEGWGLLVATHSDSKNWEVEMVDLLVDVGNIMAIAIDCLR